jgi:hypothetical protein
MVSIGCSNRGRRFSARWCARRWSRPVRSGERYCGASFDGRSNTDPGW